MKGFFRFFENEERVDSIYIDQKYAGLILQKINPKTEQSVDLILDRTLKNWNKSLEELPFWLKNNYGIENIKKHLVKSKKQIYQV
ncbi:hypothetical protein [Flavobacterium ajazii]|uniref:hypothetical protein n=1 Tax=Flavobacterium ajazii TaxID=2692318 RepID=UPI0013D558CE|nr:hypothetical protein [Flavobacterium ajazii]